MGAIDVLGPDARRTLLGVLACVVRADGTIGEDERAAFRGACIALGLPDEPLAGIILDALDLERVSRRDAMLIYCAAYWMALADAVRLREESRFLARLAQRLNIESDTARFLAAHARWVRTSTELAWHREFDLLLHEAALRLARLEAAAAA